MNKKKYKKILNMAYTESYYDEKLNWYFWWVDDPKFIDELEIHTFNSQSEKPFQIHIKWSKRALKEFGKYLVNLSNYKTLDPDYHDHFDEADELAWNTEIIVHHPDSIWRK